MAGAQKVAAAVYHKIFNEKPQQKSSKSYATLSYMVQDPDYNKAWWFFLVLIALGWVMSARPPARPADY